MDKAQIHKHLDKADRHIKRGEKLIQEQEERVKELRRDGHKVEIHERSLRNLRDIQETMQKTRETVREELDESSDT